MMLYKPTDLSKTLYSNRVYTWTIGHLGLKYYQARNQVFHWLFIHEGPKGVKWELGLAGFSLGKWGSSHWDLDLVTGNGKKMLKIKNWNGIWELRNGIWKKNELGNGTGNPLQDPHSLIVHSGCKILIHCPLIQLRGLLTHTPYNLKSYWLIVHTSLRAIDS